MRLRCKEGNGALLVYFRVADRTYLPTERELLNTLQPVKVLGYDRFGIIYQVLPDR